MDTRPAAPSHAAKALPHITAVLNQKGGVGKTGLTVGAAGALAEMGRRVLLVDLDPQGHLTTEALRMEEIPEGHPTLAGALAGEHSTPITALAAQRPAHPSGGQVSVVPTSTDMFLLVRKLYAIRAGERRLARLLDQIPEGGVYDHVLIDCPPSLDIITDNALVAADGLVIPVQPNNTSLRALRLLIEQLAAVEDELQLHRRELYGLVPGIYRRPLSGIARYKMEQLEQYGQPVAGEVALPIIAHLPLTAAVEEAWLQGVMLVDYEPDIPIAQEYRKIARRLDGAAGFDSGEGPASGSSSHQLVAQGGR